MDILSSDSENLLSNFHPKIKGQILELLLGQKIVLTNLSQEDILPYPGKYDNIHDGELAHSYHFALKIPYAGKRVDWDIMFNPEDIYFAPDLDTNEDVFSAYDIEIIAKNIPTWADWNIEDTKSLSKLLREFMDFYKEHQVETLRSDNIYSKILTEYEEFVESVLKNNLNDIEVMVEHNSVIFLVRIPVDCSSLPEYMQMKKVQLDNPGGDVANLRIAFNRPDGSQVSPTLYLSPRLEQLFGGTKELCLPRYCKEYSLSVYIKKVSQLLDGLVKDIENNYIFRKEFITYLATNFSDRLLEYDGERFTKADLIFDFDDCHVIITFGLGNRAPKEKPFIFLTSAYCISKGKACCELLDNYPYSPRWKFGDMVQRILQFAAEKAKELKRHKH